MRSVSLAAAQVIVHASEAVAAKCCSVLAAASISAAASSDDRALGDVLDDGACEVLVLADGDAQLALLRELVPRHRDVRIVLAGASARGGIDAMRAGAADAVCEPIDEAELCYLVRRALAKNEPCPEPHAPEAAASLLGTSPAMERVRALIGRAAPANATVLVRGQSGTGKELAARAIHDASPRAAGPFVKVHCGALPDTLLESELFGYMKGAFTGATRDKNGRVAEAEHGTLFLDEIGDITAAMQVKLLQLLQDRSYVPLGSNKPIAADVRFVAATHRDLETMVQRGEFREDLFFRLNVVPLWLPPLRARKGDVPVLAQSFCTRLGKANGRPNMRLGDDALAALGRERWPGNVRELQNLIERLVVLSDSDTIGAPDIERERVATAPFTTATGSLIASHTTSRDPSRTADTPPAPLSEQLHLAEKKALVDALAHTRGHRMLAARLLGVSRATLYAKLAEHRINEKNG
jgi:two-component system, NtrC family, response regulator AtoC